jgi:nitrate/nitrite transporter NarK
MKKLLLLLVDVTKIIFKIFLRLILLLLSMLGLGSIYGLIDIYVNDSFSESKLDAEIEAACGNLTGDAYGNCWEDFQLSSGGAGIFLIFFIIFILIAIPSVIYLYKLTKSDIANLRKNSKK